jgi:hypothetical protein
MCIIKGVTATHRGAKTMAYTFSILPNYYEAVGEDGPFTAVNYFVECRDLAGHTWFHFKSFSSAEAADELAARIESQRPADWTPENEHWNRGRLVYGSRAYQVEGGAHEQQKIDVEAEFGPGSYMPGLPGHLMS